MPIAFDLADMRDCAKSKWMLCDFYGKVIIEPTEVKHDAGSLGAMI